MEGGANADIYTHKMYLTGKKVAYDILSLVIM